MTEISAFVNYHVRRSERQAFHIDAGGVTGEMIAPELALTEVAVSDLRRDDIAVSFGDDSVAIVPHASRVTRFDDDRTWRETYDLELTELLRREIGAGEVVVFDHTVRVDDPHSDRRPARNVHSDYSRDGAHKRLDDLLDAKTAAEWRTGAFGFVNVWRPVEAPINSAPLGFVRPATVAEEDWITLDLIYPDRVGQIMGLVANPRHEWVFQSKMTPDEVAIFNIFDSAGRPSIAHSALDRTEDPAISVARKSIESRTLVRY
ncbi:MAG: CmcJ/NvfI family oxidoreductase [Pseudomonadota bacterium]